MIKILIVKDDASQLDLTTLETRFQELARFRRASDLDTALDYLDRGDVSCILLDSALRDVDGRDVYGNLRSKYPLIPVMLLVGEDGYTRLVNADSMSFHITHGTSDTEVFRRIVEVIEQVGPRQSMPGGVDLLEQGRLGPDASTKPPRSPPVPFDILEAATAPVTEPEGPFDDDLSLRVRALEVWVAELARELRS